jgi:opacity protein-like surface antigen
MCRDVIGFPNVCRHLRDNNHYINLPRTWLDMVRVPALTICLLLAGLSAGAVASDGLEVVPFVGHRFGGGFDDDIAGQRADREDAGNWGFAFRSTASATTRYEFLYAHQDARLSDKANPADTIDFNIRYLQLGGTAGPSRSRIIPFFSGGIGLTHLGPGRGGPSDETRMSLSFGGGLKWHPTERLGIRFEMHGYGTLMDSSGSLFCNHGCDMPLSSDLFHRFETNLDLIFHF